MQSNHFLLAFKLTFSACIGLGFICTVRYGMLQLQSLERTPLPGEGTVTATAPEFKL